MKKALPTPSAAKALGPYSHVVESGGWLYLSGQIPLVPATGELVEGGIKEQATRVMDTIEALLSDIELSTDNIVKTTIYLTDLNDFATVNEIYGSRFRAPYPARVTIAVAGLPKGARIEIEAIARRGA